MPTRLVKRKGTERTRQANKRKQIRRLVGDYVCVPNKQFA